MKNRLRLIGAALLVAALAACSSSAKSSSPGTSTTTAAGPSTTAPPAPCVPPPPNPRVVAVPVAGVASDWTLTSFDGTAIRLHWFPAPTATTAKPLPTVLMGPGWGEAGDTNVTTSGTDLFGALGISSLQKAGFNVLTWDPRGFGKSKGTVEIDSADFEGRDVQAMLDWISSRPGVLLDGARDPRVGMAGGSYGAASRSSPPRSTAASTRSRR